MSGSDICVDIGDTRVNLRAACILRSEESVLLCQAIGENWWFVPGGRVRTGESFYDAVRREIAEEIGCAVSVGRCVVLNESFFEHRGIRFQEIGAYFLAELEADRDLVAVRHENELREWIPVSEARHMEIYPEFLRHVIGAPPQSMEHIVCRDHHDAT